jgi:Transposase
MSKIREKVLASLPTCPIPEIKQLGKTLKQWREAFLAYFDTGRANNGGTEAINGLMRSSRSRPAAGRPWHATGPGLQPLGPRQPRTPPLPAAGPPAAGKERRTPALAAG